MTGPRHLRLLHAPGHAPDFTMATVEYAEATTADVILFTEAYRVARELMTRPDYSCRMGKSDVNTRVVKSPRGDAGDNPVLVRRNAGFPILESSSIKVDNPGTPEKWAPERWRTRVVVKWAHRKTAIYSVHPSPYFTGPLKWRRVMRSVLAEVSADIADGYLVILAGDLQTRFAGKMIRAVGLKVLRVRIDYIAHSPELTPHLSQMVAPHGMDHPWLRCMFTQAD